MSLPAMLDHDAGGYAQILDRIIDISKAWRSSRAQMHAQLTQLNEIWGELRNEPDCMLPRSMAAHLLADLQSDPREELRWDLESLRSLAPIWAQGNDPRKFDVACRFLPSIYLSLAVASRKCGDFEAAREYLRRARLLAPILDSCDYTDRLNKAVRRLGRDLDAR